MMIRASPGYTKLRRRSRRAITARSRVYARLCSLRKSWACASWVWRSVSGLADEAEIIAEILGCEFEVVSICCKQCGISKKQFGLEQIDPDKDPEVMCNPAGQATLLNEAGTELNILCGLCVGHDAIFSMKSQAPVTTLIIKDRVLAHNPIGAIYSQYIRRTMLPPEK